MISINSSVVEEEIDLCDQNYKSLTYLHKLQAGNRITDGEGSTDVSLCHATYVKEYQ